MKNTNIRPNATAHSENLNCRLNIETIKTMTRNIKITIAIAAVFSWIRKPSMAALANNMRHHCAVLSLFLGFGGGITAH